MTDLEGYKLQFESEFDVARMEVLKDMPQNFTQEQKALTFGVSIRTIQHFEKGRNRNYWLLFCYRLKAYGDAVV